MASIPNYQQLSDDELMRWDGREFARRVIERAELWALDVADPRRFRRRALDPDEARRALIQWHQHHAWLEWWLGVPPPSRQLLLLPEEDLALKVRLAQQVIDEVKHQRAHCRRVHALGGESRLEKLAPRPQDRRTQAVTFNETPLDIAASLQCTGEVVLMTAARPEVSVLYELLPEESARDMLEEIAPEEPRHVKIGEDLVARYADTPALRRRVLAVQDAKLRALYPRYCADYALLGADRAADEPTW